jgi:cytosine/adenosine deaminase-related metal-dependent hydrolase
MIHLHLGHVYHLRGAPTVTAAPQALVSIPDGALVIDDSGHIVYCGERSDLPAEHASATVHDHRPGFLLPGFVDTHIHFPQTYAGDSYGGGQPFKVHINEPGTDGVSMHPAEMLFIGILGGARALDMESRFGNFDVGKEADFVVIDPARTPALNAAVRHGVRSDDHKLAREQALFTLLMGIRETSIAEVYVQGRRLR